MKLDRGALRLGAEIEVPRWTGRRNYISVANELNGDGYMMGGPSVWQSTHDYHCSCEKGGCRLVRKGVLIDPPLVSMTYDATLPKSGAEFIMSPIMVNEESMHHLRSIWSRVVDKAEWTTDLTDIKGRPCSPSVHLHVSATQELSKFDHNTPTDPHGNTGNFADDALHAISLFSPEFFLLADTAGLRRGLTYRLPDRYSMLNLPKGLHHGFVQVRKALKGKQVYIEWRLFEAAYDNWNYIEQCAYLASGLTRALLDETIYQQLMRIGYEYPYDVNAVRQAVQEDDAGKVLLQVNPERLKALSDLVTTQMDDDPYATYLVSELFDNAKAKVQQ